MFDSSISFINPEIFLLLLPVIVFLFFLYFKSDKNTYFGPFDDLKKIYGGDSFFYKIKYILLFIISVLIIAVLANPVQKLKEKKIKRNGLDIEIVFDLSYSMVAEDLKPNRLEVGKKVLIDFIKSIKTDRVGLILFSGKPFNSVPLSFDYNFLVDFISTITIDTISQHYSVLQGTAIGDSIILAIDSLKDSKDREKVIILITDGEANKGIDPLLALKKAKEEKIKIYTIGVGGKETTYVDVMVGLFPRKIEIGGIDEETLKKIAIETKGKYYRASSNETFKEIFDDISKLEKKDIEVETIKNNQEKYTVFLYFLLLFFLFFFCLKYKKNI